MDRARDWEEGENSRATPRTAIRILTNPLPKFRANGLNGYGCLSQSSDYNIYEYSIVKTNAKVTNNSIPFWKFTI